MALLGRLALLALLTLSGVASAQVTPYEWVFQAGRNGLIDSNAQSCDAVEGCYTRTGRRCAGSPGQICDLQVVPAGRCTSGDLATGQASCVWPHNAGRCVSNTKIGCLTDAFAFNPVLANAFSGPSFMCSGLASNSCDMTIDKLGDAQTPAEIVACSCQGTDAAAASFETAICGGTRPVCSDGDPARDTGGYGWARGDELIIGAPGTQSFASLGPSVNGAITPSTSPRYPIENPPSVFDAQRDAGTVGRTPAGRIRPVRTTDARAATALFPGLDVWLQRAHGDSFWSDPSYATVQVTGTFKTHEALLPCAPPAGWSVDDPVDGGSSCHAAAQDGLALLWRRDLTAVELASNPTCPPNCLKDFDLTTVEAETFVAVADQDQSAGLQLALQSGEGRQAGANDVLSARRLTLAAWIVDSDLRCRLGGWGNAPGFVGRCSDGPTACVPGDAANGDALCAGQGGACRACNGPIDSGNPLGLPPGYSAHGLADLDLVAGQRLGIVANAAVDVLTPVLLVGTSGSAGAEFRDLPGEGAFAAFDLADLGPVSGTVTPFGVGIGPGGTFVNGSTLPIGEPCCAGGVDVSWGAAQPGEPLPGALLRRTFDSGPGADGIPACLGDNPFASNGADACNQRLGTGAVGAKTDSAFNTGLDDVAGGGSSARFGMRNWPDPTFNQVSALALRDQQVLIPRNQDSLLKLNVSYCPIVAGVAKCGFSDEYDPCTSPDEPDSDADGVADVCDNCLTISNPRVAAGYLATNAWATLTGRQRDDDHDGYGNKCDAKFPGVAGSVVNASDLAQFRASNGKSRGNDTCGTLGTRPCAIFDLDETGALINSTDLTRFRQLNGKVPGPKCPSCPLACEAGAAGSCF